MAFNNFGGNRPGGFGGFGGASQTPAFGAQSNPPPAFGQSAPGFGAPQTSTSSFGFGQPPSTPAQGFGASSGGFGAQQTPGFGGQSLQTPAFGAAQPAAPSFGGFGAATNATPAFTFGNQNKSTFGTPGPAAGGLFSQPTGGMNAFGAGSGNLFGAGAQQPLDPSKWPDEFGDLFMVGHPADQDDSRIGWIQPAIPADGTGNTAFFDPTNPREYKEPFGSEDGKNTPAKLREERVRSGWTGNPLDWDPVKKKLDSRKDSKLRYHAITAVEPFRNSSFEELRLQDYMQNRRTPTQQKPQEKIMAYNQFSADPPVPQGGAGMAFGGTAPGGFSFGAKPAGFGTPASNNAFGSTPSQTPFSTGTNLFGGQPAATGFGAGASTGFGSNTGAFGSTAPSFGANPSTSGGFGIQTSAAPNTGFGGFGATPPQNQQPANPFGQNTPSSGAGLFGSTPASTSTAPSFGGFGSAAKPLGGGGFNFGQPATSAPATGGLFGNSGSAGTLFGGAAQTQQTNPFGQPAAPNPFGASQPPANNTLFGGGSNPFGQNTNTQAPAFGGFKAPTPAPAAPSFNLGQAAQNPTFNFGNTAQNKPLGGFGTQSAAPSFGGFGASNSTGGLGAASNPFGFGSTLGQSTQQPTLQASIDQNAYGQSPLFNTAAAAATEPAAPFAVPEKNKPPLSLPPRGTPRSMSAINRLRGMNSPTTGMNGTTLSFSSPSSVTRASPLSSLPTLGDGSANSISPRAFIGRTSVKKLVIAPKSAGSPSASGSTPARLRFDPEAEIAVAEGTPIRQNASAATPAPIGSKSISSESARRTNGTTPSSKSPGRSPYALTPSLEELRRLSPEELKRVDGFKVSRPGMGEIAWEGPVDLSGIGSLDRIGGDIVKIEPRKASVYAVEDFKGVKPAEGEGLNTPARVTLHDIWPIDLSTRQPIKERGLSADSDARINDFERKLTDYNVKRPTVTKAMYDFDNGTWYFNVRHFSGYGLDDDDELIDGVTGGVMDVEDTGSGGRSKRARSDDGSVVNEDMETEIEDVDDQSFDDEGPPTPLSLSTDRERTMSDDNDYEEARQQVAIPRDSDQGSSQSSKDVSPPFTRSLSPPRWTSGFEAEREQLMQQTLFAGQRPSKPAAQRQHGMRFVLPVATEDFPSDPLPPAEIRRPHDYSLVAFGDSVAYGLEANILDAGLAFSRSFRVAFGPHGELVRPRGTLTRNDLVVSKPLAACLEPTSNVDDMLRLQLARTDVVPTQRLTPQGAFLAPLALTQDTLRFRDFLSGEEDLPVMKMASALFDDLDLDLPTDADHASQQYAAQLLRQRALSRCLEGDVQRAAEADARSARSEAAQIFARLTGHQIEEACEIAFSARDFRLATLLAQAGTQDANVRSDIELQLHLWRQQRVDAHIDPDLRKVYELLAGNVSDSKGVTSGERVDQSPSLFIPAGLDWRRAFGLHLWYAAPGQSLPVAFASYENAIVADPRIARPAPDWAVRLPSAAPDGIEDAGFAMLRLAATDYPLESALDSRGFAPSAYDVSMPWHFASTLVRGLRIRSFEDAEGAPQVEASSRSSTGATADMLSTAYASQLEISGSWPWAIFVLMHLGSAESRMRGIREVLARNVDKLDDSEATEMLTGTLGVPAEWLYEAQALRAHYVGDLWQEMNLRHMAQDFDGAHRLCVAALAPEAVLSEDLHLLQRLFEPLEQYDISGWQDGGGLFLDYAACLDRQCEVATIRRASPRLLATLPSLVASRGKTDLRAAACYRRMLARISRLASAADDSLHSLDSVELGALSSDARCTFLADATMKTFQAALAAACG